MYIDLIEQNLYKLTKHFDLIDITDRRDDYIEILLRKYPFERIGVYRISYYEESLKMRAGYTVLASEIVEEEYMYVYEGDIDSVVERILDDMYIYFQNFCRT